MKTTNEELHPRDRGYKRAHRDNTLAWIIGIVLTLGIIFAIIYSVNAVSTREQFRNNVTPGTEGTRSPVTNDNNTGARPRESY